MIRFLLFLGVFFYTFSAQAQDFRQNFHVDPSCWSEPRIVQQWNEKDFVWKPDIQSVNDIPIPARKAAVSADAEPYFFWPDESSLTLYIDTGHAPSALKIGFPEAKGISETKWVNESTLFVRVWYSRIWLNDFLIDVENGKVVSTVPGLYAENAYNQYQESCRSRCPCKP